MLACRGLPLDTSRSPRAHLQSGNSTNLKGNVTNEIMHRTAVPAEGTWSTIAGTIKAGSSWASGINSFAQARASPSQLKMEKAPSPVKNEAAPLLGA